MLRQDYFRNRLVSKDFELLIVFGVFSLPLPCVSMLAASRAQVLRAGTPPSAGWHCVCVSWLRDSSSPGALQSELGALQSLLCQTVLCHSLTSAVS